MIKMSNKDTKLNAPLTVEKITSLRAGDMVLLSGKIIGARDMAHKRLIEALKKEKLPVELKDQVIFYLGPSPTPPGKISGSIGPTTSARMDGLSEPLLSRRCKSNDWKGRGGAKDLNNLLVKYKAVYFIAPGGVAAFSFHQS